MAVGEILLCFLLQVSIAFYNPVVIWKLAIPEKNQYVLFTKVSDYFPQENTCNTTSNYYAPAIECSVYFQKKIHVLRFWSIGLVTHGPLAETIKDYHNSIVSVPWWLTDNANENQLIQLIQRFQLVFPLDGAWMLNIFWQMLRMFWFVNLFF